jgi:hypothetical protein
MTYSALGGKRTAKRRIQIRQYVSERAIQAQCQSDPFMPDDENLSSEYVLNCRPVKLSFQLSYVPETEGNRPDEILSSKINLDEADRFIAVLRIPSHSPSKRSQLVTPRVHTPVDLSSYRAECEKLEKLRLTEVEDPSETEEDDM